MLARLKEGTIKETPPLQHRVSRSWPRHLNVSDARPHEPPPGNSGRALNRGNGAARARARSCAARLYSIGARRGRVRAASTTTGTVGPEYACTYAGCLGVCVCSVDRVVLRVTRTVRTRDLVLSTAD